jgi:hypothetical protein
MSVPAAVDSTPPTLTLSGPASSSVRYNDFTLTANENLNCSTLDKDDFSITVIRVIGVVNGVNAKSCTVQTVTLIAPKTQKTGSLTPSRTFSVSDTAGNAATTISSGSPAQIALEITDE